MGRKYRIHDQSQVYFVTFTVVNWIDLFVRDEYRELIISSIQHCQQHKGLEVYAWCIMTSHVHLIIGTEGTHKLEDIIRDLKSFTSRKIRMMIETHQAESRREWMLWMFGSAGRHNSNNNDWQLWQQNNHPIELSTQQMALQRLNYLHYNPVAAGFVPEPHYWTWSSAHDYNGGKGLIDIIFLE